ncbi:MAG: BTAD domain-containing putative transcriptional regulator [Sphingomonadaceae bacterium]
MADGAGQTSVAHIRLMGLFRLSDGGGVPVSVTSRRARALIGYLSLAPNHSATRERLCGLLWSDRGDAQARSSLRQCLLEIKTATAPFAIDVLTARRDEIELNHCESDCAALDAALDGDDPDIVVAQLSALGTAQLLEDQDIGGLYGEWLDQTRTRFDQMLGAHILSHIERSHARDDFAAVTAVADAYLQRDPLDERIVAAAIRADIALGARASAQRRFRQLKTALASELGVDPSAVVQAALEGDESLPSPHLPRMAAETTDPLLAVLAFDNLSSDPEMDFFSDGVSEEILQRLSRASPLKVIARSSSFQFRGADKVTANVAARLGVTHVLDGSVRRGGVRVRITAALIECHTQITLWSGRFDHDLDDPFAVQDEIAAAVALGLNQLFAPSSPPLRIDSVAHDHYLRARSLAALPPRVDDCLNHLALAVERVPDYAAAWSSLAMARAVKARWMTPADEFAHERDAAMLAAARATTLDPSAGLPLGALSLIEPDGNFPAREALLDRALALAPLDPEILKQAADFASSVGRLEECYHYADRAAEIDPLNPLIAGNRAQALLDLGQSTEEGFAIYDELRGRYPDLDWLIAMPMIVAANMGDRDRAARLLALPPGTSREYQMARRTVELIMGPREALIAHARATVEKQLSRNGRVEIRTIMFMHNVGMTDEAFDAWRYSDYDYRKGHRPDQMLLTGMIFGVTNGAMRRDPRFLDICDGLGLCAYWVATDRWPDCVAEVASCYDFKAEATARVARSNG